MEGQDPAIGGVALERMRQLVGRVGQSQGDDVDGSGRDALHTEIVQKRSVWARDERRVPDECWLRGIDHEDGGIVERNECRPRRYADWTDRSCCRHLATR